MTSLLDDSDKPIELPPDENPIKLPSGPKCLRCGHMPCPICQHWCDILDCKECGIDTDNLECIYDEKALSDWLHTIQPLLEQVAHEKRWVVDQDSETETVPALLPYDNRSVYRRNRR